MGTEQIFYGDGGMYVYFTRSSVPCDPLMSRDIVPFWMAVRIAAVPVGSGRLGAVILIIGVPNSRGFRSSAEIMLTGFDRFDVTWKDWYWTEFQKRVMPNRSAQLYLPSTTSAKVPPERSGQGPRTQFQP